MTDPFPNSPIAISDTFAAAIFQLRAERELRRDPRQCPTCEGNGYLNEYGQIDPAVCPDCDGTGEAKL